MLKLKVHFSQFDPRRLLETSIETKTSKPKPDPQNPQNPPQSVQYNEFPILYEYDSTDQAGKACKVVAPLAIEFPLLDTSVGIQIKKMPSGGDSASIFTQFDLRSQEIKDCVAFCTLNPADGMPKMEADGSYTNGGCIDKLYRHMLLRLWKLKCQGQLQSLSRHTNLFAMEGIFAYPIFWPRDPQSKVIEGKPPSKYFNLINSGAANAATRKETIFRSPVKMEGSDDYYVWPWEFLKAGVEMKFRPVVEFDKVFIGGGKASIQCKMREAVVPHCVPANKTSSMKDTLDSMAKKDDVVSTIKSQIEAITRAHAEAKARGADTTPKTGEVKELPAAKGGEIKAPAASAASAAPATYAQNAQPPPSNYEPYRAPQSTPTPSGPPSLPPLPQSGLQSFVQGGPTIQAGPGGIPGLPSIPGLPLAAMQARQI